MTPSLRAPLVLGWVCVLVAGLGLGGWAVMARLASAIVAPGMVDPSGQIIPLAPRQGGVVTEILVVEAQAVRAGDVLLRLADPGLVQELAQVAAQIEGLDAVQARLVAEGAEGQGAVDWLALGDQHRLFTTRRDLRDRQRALISREREQLVAEIAGLEAQERAVMGEQTLLLADLETREALRVQGLTTSDAGRAVQLALTRAEGARAAVAARLAAAQGRDAVLAAQLEAQALAHRAEVETQRAEVERALTELRLRHAALGQRLDALSLVAPVAGQVLRIEARAGAPLAAGQVALHLIDTQHPARLIALIAPQDIDGVYLGQPAQLHPIGQITPGGQAINALVTEIPAAPEPDAQGRSAHYRVGLSLATLPPDMSPILMPGMQFQVFVATGQHRPVDALLGPLAQRLRPIWHRP